MGLFALMISIFSSQLLAAKTAECDGVTKKNGLYGLCVAWHSADDKAKDKIAAKFFDRARYPVPGSEDPEPEPDPEPTPDFFCPCWTDVSMADVCSLGNPSSALLMGFINVVTWVDDLNGVDEFFSADEFGCIYDGQFAAQQVLDNLTDDEKLDCLAEIESIAAMYNGGSCD